jgi:hypothetical protein
MQRRNQRRVLVEVWLRGSGFILEQNRSPTLYQSISTKIILLDIKVFPRSTELGKLDIIHEEHISIVLGSNEENDGK